MISDADLVEWGRRGIFPGPRESVSGFLQRARECSVVSEPAVNCFGVKPNWIPIRLDAQNLSLWEAAATWIEESEEGVSCFIQIHPSGKYPKEQVIAHEMVHAMRMGFEHNVGRYLPLKLGDGFVRSEDDPCPGFSQPSFW